VRKWFPFQPPPLRTPSKRALDRGGDRNGEKTGGGGESPERSGPANRTMVRPQPTENGSSPRLERKKPARRRKGAKREGRQDGPAPRRSRNAGGMNRKLKRGLPKSARRCARQAKEKEDFMRKWKGASLSGKGNLPTGTDARRAESMRWRKKMDL